MGHWVLSNAIRIMIGVMFTVRIGNASVRAVTEAEIEENAFEVLILRQSVSRTKCSSMLIRSEES